jgi:ADP-heptose:LPS heptosyltransferase
LLIKPNFPEACYNMGNALLDQGRVDVSLLNYEKAIALKPDYPEAQFNKAFALHRKTKFEEALASYEHALSLKPDYAEAYHNMGTVFSALGKVEDAMKSYNKALSLRPNYPDAYDNLGRLHWSLQNFSTAFELMEWRWQKKQKFIGTEFKDDMPIWDGSASKKVFVWKEQGIGDEIMFSSVFSELNATSQEVIIECDTRLLQLFERSFPSDIKFVEGRNLLQECNYNCHIALASLPKHFRTELDDFSKSANGWLKPDYKKVEEFKRQIQSHNAETIIGVSWFTNASGPRSRQRSISLVNLAKHLGSIPATFVNLQYGDVAEELLSVKSQTNFNIISIDDLDLFHDIDGLAALVSACDIVVSVDNLTVHLAGALGVDTRVLLPSVADERWALDRKDSYWYDSLTLYRQQINGNWDQPLELLINDLKAR